MRHRPDELVGRVRIDVECDALSRPDPSDIGLVNVGVHLHLGEVCGDDEERRRLQARRDGLPHIDAALYDDPVDGRLDDRVIQIHLVLVDGCLRLAHGCLRLGDRRLLRCQRCLCAIDRYLGSVEVALRNQVAGGQLFGAGVLLLRVDELDLGPLEVALRFGEVRLRLHQAGTRRLKLRIEERGVELRDHLSFVHDRVEVGAQIRDVARDLTTDLHRRDGLQRAGRADRIDDLPTRHRRRVHGDVAAAAAYVIRPGTHPDGGDDEENEDRTLHGRC